MVQLLKEGIRGILILKVELRVVDSLFLADIIEKRLLLSAQLEFLS
jgi:hypothetical protein